jgi:hypothetical protein
LENGEAVPFFVAWILVRAIAISIPKFQVHGTYITLE